MINWYWNSHSNWMKDCSISFQCHIRIWTCGLTLNNLWVSQLDSKVMKYDITLSSHYLLIQVFRFILLNWLWSRFGTRYGSIHCKRLEWCLKNPRMLVCTFRFNHWFEHQFKTTFWYVDRWSIIYQVAGIITGHKHYTIWY